MSTIAVVDVITEYLMTFEPLFGDKKKRGVLSLCQNDCQKNKFCKNEIIRKSQIDIKKVMSVNI